MALKDIAFVIENGDFKNAGGMANSAALFDVAGRLGLANDAPIKVVGGEIVSYEVFRNPGGDLQLSNPSSVLGESVQDAGAFQPGLKGFALVTFAKAGLPAFDTSARWYILKVKVDA